GASSGEGFKDAGVWVQSLYSDATQGQRDGIAGYNAYSSGVAVGADGKLNDNLTLGLAYSFINTDVNGKSGNKTEVDSHAFTLYGGFEQGNYFVDTSLTYGFNDNQGKRSIAGTRAKADYDSDLLGLNLVGGYTYHVSPQVLVEPRVAARYSQVNIDGYREKGSSAALKVEDQRYETIELGAGMRVAGRFLLGAGTLEPQAKLMAYHDFAADEAQSTSTFLLGSTPFVTSGAKAVRDSYEAGVGADYKLGAVTLGVNYDYIGKSDFDADVFSAKVRYDF
ncbi:autotransporter outer membrane beta-barrel domain-containing protein, partial [Pseudomonas syringae]